MDGRMAETARAVASAWRRLPSFPARPRMTMRESFIPEAMTRCPAATDSSPVTPFRTARSVSVSPLSMP